MARFGTGSLCDLTTSIGRILPQLKERLDEIVRNADFVLGQPVFELEQRLVEHFGARYCVSVANGTDAIKLSLLAANISPRSLILCPTFTFQACGNAILDTPAALAFTDVDLDTMTVTADTLERALSSINRAEYDRIFLLGVDLFGLPCITNDLAQLCDERAIELVVDAAQSLGAQIGDSFGVACAKLACTSFFPSKPLGTLGDGGAIFCSDEALANRLRSLRNHGAEEYGLLATRPGLNSRLDSIHAAALTLLLDYERSDFAARRDAAATYRRILEPRGLKMQAEPVSCKSAYSTLTVRTARDRDLLLKRLRGAGIECQVFYRYPLHQHPAFSGAINAHTAFPNSESLARSVLSLPLHPFLDARFFDRIEMALSEC